MSFDMMCILHIFLSKFWNDVQMYVSVTLYVELNVNFNYNMFKLKIGGSLCI